MTEMTATETPAPRIPRDDEFGTRLALVRHLMGWNVKEAARECGVPAASWRLWEVDGALPRNLITICMAVAARANVDLDWLVYGPNRGGKPLMDRYARQSRVVTKLPMQPTEADTTRSVRQTRPIVGRLDQTYAHGSALQPVMV